MLKAAGYPNGLNLTVLYNAESTSEPKMYQTLQADMAPAGIHLKALAVPSADLYVKYLTVPSTATNGTWDIAMSGWGPDWYGDAAASFFGPIYSGAPSFPPVGSNFSQYNNPAVNALITKAASQASAVAAGKLWAQDRPDGDDGGTDLPDHPGPAAQLPLQLRAQRGVRAGDPELRPDQRLAEHARLLVG